MKTAKPGLIGLTGGIASGKSTAAKEFSRLGFTVIYADAVSKELTGPGKLLLKKIAGKFGSSVIKKDGSLNRKKLAAIVFTSSKKRILLEKLTHPAIIAEIKLRAAKLLKNSKQPVIVEAPLLFEARLENIFDRIIVVWSPEKLQIKRLRDRNGMGMISALNRLRAQIPLNKKLKLADFVIDNSKTIPATRKQVKTIFERLTKV